MDFGKIKKERVNLEFLNEFKDLNEYNLREILEKFALPVMSDEENLKMKKNTQISSTQSEFSTYSSSSLNDADQQRHQIGRHKSSSAFFWMQRYGFKIQF